MCVKSITLIATQTSVSDTHEYVCDLQLVPYMTRSRIYNWLTLERCLKIAEAAFTTACMCVTMYIGDFRKKNNTFKYQKNYRLCVHGTYDALYAYAL
jgi:hypothetical protein